MNCSLFTQIFGSEARDEETEVWFVDIAYDEIPERHYKESEVRGVKLLTSGLTASLYVCAGAESELMHAHAHITEIKEGMMENRGESVEMNRRRERRVSR